MITLDEKTVFYIFKSKINHKNADQIAGLIISNSSNVLLSKIIEMIATDERLTEFKPNDYFKVKTPYGLQDKIYIDTLIDMGLYEDGYIFGKIIKSAVWNVHDKHDPFYMHVNCELFLEEKVPYKDSLYIFDLVKVEKNEIPYFNGTNIERIIDLAHPGIFDIDANAE